VSPRGFSTICRPGVTGVHSFFFFSCFCCTWPGTPPSYAGRARGGQGGESVVSAAGEVPAPESGVRWGDARQAAALDSANHVLARMPRSRGALPAHGWWAYPPHFKLRVLASGKPRQVARPQKDRPSRSRWPLTRSPLSPDAALLSRPTWRPSCLSLQTRRPSCRPRLSVPSEECRPDLVGLLGYAREPSALSRS
jgi:hypothetical protein